MYNSIIEFIEKDTTKIEKFIKESLLSGNMMRFEEELLENVIDLLEYQHKKEQMQKRIKKQDELVREVKRNHRISGEETLRKEIPGLERASFREGKIEGKVEILYEELHMTVAEIAEKLVISEEEVQKIVDASKWCFIKNVVIIT